MRPTTSKESLNLTLVGETASGKTTLLNSLANYSQYPTLDEAIGNGPIVLADVGFAYNVPAGNRASVYVKGSVQNGGEQINGSGVTRTENCSFYTINIDESSNVKLYDSPGFGSQSPNQVDWARRPTHALCVVLKADETRLNPEFRSFLEKEGKAFSKNIVYCFTYCRVHNYLPSAATLALLRKFLLDLEGLLGVEFPTRKENIFCFENDCFRYLCYLSKSSGDKGRHHEKLSIEWKRNVKEYERLISSVNSLNPVLEEEHSGMNSAPNLLKTTKGKAASDSQTLAFSMSVLEEIPATHQATVPAVLQNVDLPLETKLEMLRAMKLEESVISKAADHLRPDFRLLLTESRRQTVNFLLKEEDWSVLKTVISVESTEIQAAYTAFLEKVAANGGRVPADPSEPAEGSSSSSNRPKEAQNSDQKNQENEAKAEKKSRFFDGFPEEMNILLLGEDGSGKVEFINSFANYLKYENFDEALKNGPEVVIPTDSISLVQDLNSAEMTYIPAEAETVPRETQKTQASKMYSFMADGAQKILRFIDTPDLIQDYPYWNTEKDKHLTNVLELVKNFGPIHAILIFVKSDIDHVWYHGTYLADAYKKLHHQASKNIIFCSTSIAKTSYRPGGSAVIRFAGWPYHFIAEHEVRPAKNNTYCFEIDSYSLLYAQKKSLDFISTRNFSSSRTY